MPYNGRCTFGKENSVVPARKTARVQERKRLVNRKFRSGTRTAVKKALAAIEAGNEAASTIVQAASSALDRAASKGIVHRNNAARRKSRLMKRLDKAQ